MDEAYHDTLTAIMEAIGRGFDAGLGHAALVEILRDTANDLEHGDLARDPYGPRDSRLIDARAVAEVVAAVNDGQMTVHLVAGEAGELDSYETWVHSVHASVADAKAVVQQLNQLAEAVREASTNEEQAAIRQLLEADQKHPAAGWMAEELVGLARGLLIEPGTTYSLDSRPLEVGRAMDAASTRAPGTAKAAGTLDVADVAAEASEQYSETLRYLADHPSTFDPTKRLADKQAARDQDDADLAAGRVTPEELQRRNSFAVGLDLANATVRVPNPDAWGGPVSLDEAQDRMKSWINDVLTYAEEHDAPAELIGHARAAQAALEQWQSLGSKP